MSVSAYYEDEYSIVYLGDALAVLQQLETGSVDGLVTDPPYSSGGMVRSDRMAKTSAKYVQSDSANQSLSDFSGDNRDQRAYAYWMAMWLAEAARVVKPGGVCLLFTDWRQLPSTSDSLQAGGWVWRGLVPWVKPAARPMAGRFTNQAEYVVWGSNGSMGLNFDDPVLPGFYLANSPREREHITHLVQTTRRVGPARHYASRVLRRRVARIPATRRASTPDGSTCSPTGQALAPRSRAGSSARSRPCSAGGCSTSSAPSRRTSSPTSSPARAASLARGRSSRGGRRSRE